MLITLELELDEVNYIQNILGKQPFIEVSDIINKIKTQGEKQYNNETANR